MIKIVCLKCGSDAFVKKGCNSKERFFQCKVCNKRFKYSRDDLVGTIYEIIDEPSTKQFTSHNTIMAQKLTPNNNIYTENTINKINFKSMIRDKNGNYLMRIGNNPPIPLGRTENEIKEVMRKYGDSCKLETCEDGVFKLIVNNTTKG